MLDKGELRKQFLWLYGVIVGLVIREATTDGVSVIIHPKTPLERASIFLFLMRFAVLMLMVIRFYLGAFSVMTDGSEATSTVTSEVANFLAGLAHFILFFAWASTLGATANFDYYWNLSEFEIFLLAVLLYDVVWWIFSYNNCSTKLKRWAQVNLATAILCFAIHVVAAKFNRPILVEVTVFLPVFVVSLMDIGEILTRKSLFGFTPLS